MMEEIWDGIVDGWSYFISFQWLSDFWEAVSGVFENMGEFSVFGLVMGLGSFGMVFALKKWMLMPFLVHMGGLSYWFWMIATYVACFIAGYFIGKHFEESG